MADAAAIGKIRYFDRENRRGVITRQDIASQQAMPEDLYFQANENQAGYFRVGQLVRFVVANDEARDVEVLSETA